VKKIKTSKRSEMMVFGFLLVIFNSHILTGASPAGLLFYPDIIANRNFLNIIAHPFVHVTWYHLFLDAGAFFILYAGLLESSRMLRLTYLVFCGAGSIFVSTLLAPQLNVYGLCGLSGIAHGLMVISAFEMIKTENRTLGIICALLVIVKSIVEAVTGEVFFSFLHFDMVGLPIAVTHLGGVLGGICIYFLTMFFNRSQTLTKRALHGEIVP